jgi:hypothetical protein
MHATQKTATLGSPPTRKMPGNLNLVAHYLRKGMTRSERTETRFKEPNLHAHLIKRVAMGNVVIDHEDVTRTFPEGPGKVELVCVYLVEQGKIQSASFSFGPAVLAI